ncbi:MAG TPA: ATP-binding protein [Candidatus Sulfotelmatobacter sp.]|nr:ATP-binding protein [Candidatus Sulfotelmatobacter sp.]
MTASAIHDAPGRPLRFIGTMEDISERKQAEAALREQAQLAQLRADVTQVLQQPGAMPGLLRGILESYPQFQPPQANIHLDDNLPVVLGNQTALTQCFSNLLGNAIKFAHPGQTPEVRVWAALVPSPQPAAQVQQCQESLEAQDSRRLPPESAIPAPPSVRIWFEDKGIGIVPQYQDKIWGVFQRLNKSYERTGIGLALVRKAVERMGGRAGVESELGKGSRFWVELRQPRREPQPSPSQERAHSK